MSSERSLAGVNFIRRHPLPAVARKLREVLGDAGSVIVWSQSFEKGRNNELGEAVPELVGFFAGVNERIVDLMVPFKQGYYDHPKFLGSASIKKVLPVLVPDLSYKELEVQEGKSASRLWREAVVERKMTEAECTSTLGNLRTYCELDTLAMVRILEAITALAAT